MKMLATVQLSPHKYKTTEGYLICQDCIIARTGKQTYLRSEIYDNDPDGNEFVEIDRSEEQVFDPKTIASFENKPLTIEHPDGSVNPSNYKNLSVGNVHNVHKGDYQGEPVMYADIVVYDAEAINKIESGEMVELSCGYDCDITDGPNPEQINIRGNHVALCEQGRAGIARIQDSWGAKPITDSIGRGTLIQEFGKQGKQYKISKIVGNVIYAESLETGKNILFKKDEENIEWATISKSEVKDSISEDVLFDKVMDMIKNDKIDDDILLLITGDEYTLGEARFDLKNNPAKIARILIQEEVITPKHFEDQKVKDYDCAARLKELKAKKIQQGSLDEEEEEEYWYCKSIVEADEAERDYINNGDKLHRSPFGDAVSKNRALLHEKEPHYTISLEEATLYHSMDGIGRASGYVETPEEKLIFDNFEEAKKAAQDLFDKYKDKTEIKKGSYSYYSVKIIEWSEGGGNFINMNKQNNGPFPALTAFNRKELPEILKKDLGIQDSLKTDEALWDSYYDFFNDVYDYIDQTYGAFVAVDDEQISEDTYRIRIFDKIGKVNWPKTKAYIKQLIQRYKGLSLIGFGTEAGWFDAEEHIKIVYTIDIKSDGEQTKFSDSENKHYIIALEDPNNESVWLDEWDRPTKDFNKAKKFNSYEEADSHRKTYCKGSVQEIKDSLDLDGLLKDIDLKKEIEEDIKDLPHGDIKESWGSCTINFDDKAALRKVAKKLISNYDIELFEEDPEELYIAVYGKFEEPLEKDLIDDSEKYSKRFYTNAIKALNEKLEKLEKNELLDSNQKDYESQKNSMRETIKKQIEEYEKKLGND